VYLYRAVDKAGQAVDFYLSEPRDVKAAKAFFGQALVRGGAPNQMTWDAYQASHRAGEELKPAGGCRSASRYAPARISTTSWSRTLGV
jgi:transposase-like protein